MSAARTLTDADLAAVRDLLRDVVREVISDAAADEAPRRTKRPRKQATPAMLERMAAKDRRYTGPR